MVKRGGAEVDSIIDPESDTWNVAKGFTTMKVLKQMISLDRYENIAQFGSDEMDDPTSQLPDIERRKIEGLKRFLSTLKQLLGNVSFALKKGDRERMREYVERMNFIETVMDGISSIEENAITHEKTLVLNYSHFNMCLKTLSDIKNSMNLQLNNAGLIFRESDEIDLDKIMRDISEGG